MTFNEITSILLGGDKSQWTAIEDRGTEVFAYKGDPLLRIEYQGHEETETRFEEEWANRHPNPAAYRAWFRVYYGPSLIDKKLLVFVDGYRAVLPMPKAGTTVVPQADYRFAQIVDTLDTLDEYLQRSRLTVEADSLVL
ncbi:hypothetical protein GC173_08095 [bacterium]|nr:hypothetical protein [bacterium]